MSKRYFITEKQITDLQLIAQRTRLVMRDLQHMIGDIIEKQELKE